MNAHATNAPGDVARESARTRAHAPAISSSTDTPAKRFQRTVRVLGGEVLGGDGWLKVRAGEGGGGRGDRAPMALSMCTRSGSALWAVREGKQWRWRVEGAGVGKVGL